jgi:Ni/Fe-hydrogenase subunit HybB-like protein
MRVSQIARPSRSGAVALAILTGLTLLGVGTGIYRLLVGLGRSTNLTDIYPWGLWIGFDFSLIAFSGGAFTLCAIIIILNQKRCRPIERMVVLTGWLGYVSVLVVLLVDLGRPDRFYHFLIYPNIHSPLFEISWCVLLYSVVLTLEFAPAFFEGLRKPRIAKKFHSFIVPIAIAGVTLSTLHQSTLGTLYLAMPSRLDTLWHSAMLPLFFLISSIGMGLSTVMLVTLLGYKAFRRVIPAHIMAVLGNMAKASVWVWGLYLLLKLLDLITTGEVGRALSLNTQSLWFLAELLIGVVVPIVLFSRRQVRQSQIGLGATAVLVTLGTALNRFNATLTGQAVVEGASYTPHWIELAIQFGIVAAAILVWYLAATFLPILEEDQTAVLPAPKS